MSAPFLEAIDWQRPWLAPLLPVAQPVLASPNWRDALNAAASPLRNHRGLPLRFVPQENLAPGIAYESFISTTGQVPTRDNLHDFFNALIWLTYPGIKVRLNAIQAREIARATTHGGNAESTITGARRGKTRDAATIFDENSALLVTRDREMAQALRAHDWRTVFITRRTAFMRDCEVYLFGHALIEKLVSPYKAITAHAWLTQADDTFFTLDPTARRNWLDNRVSAELTAELSTSNFTPLPVLGVPGWWNNEAESFYQDAAVFRARRTANR